MQRNHDGMCRSHARHRASSALTSLSLALLLGASAIGCSGESLSDEAGSSHAADEAGAEDAAENALIESHLQTQGYDTSTLRFQGDMVIVEDDMLMSRALLLVEAETEANGLVEKGYSLNTPNFAGKKIQLSFAAAVSNTWRTALNAAKNEWTSKTPMFSRDPGGFATISIQVQAMKNANGTNDTATLALGSVPPNRTIILNSNFASVSCGGSLEGVAAGVKAKNALHEMGHVLGYAHPPPDPSNTARTHIAGTATSPPSYQTVMSQGCVSRTALTPDDALSAQKKYPSCIATCENNCTFNVDPGAIGLCMSACPQQCGG